MTSRILLFQEIHDKSKAQKSESGQTSGSKTDDKKTDDKKIEDVSKTNDEVKEDDRKTSIPKRQDASNKDVTQKPADEATAKTAETTKHKCKKHSLADGQKTNGVPAPSGDAKPVENGTSTKSDDKSSPKSVSWLDGLYGDGLEDWANNLLVTYVVVVVGIQWLVGFLYY